MQVSVVIPCFNDQKYLPICLDSLLHQSVAPNEIIFVDNNSTDDSQNIAISFISKFKEKKCDLLISQQSQQGLLPTRRLGFKKATCDLIATIDADTILNPQWIENAIRIMSTKKYVCASGPLQATNKNITYFLDKSRVIYLLNDFFKSCHFLYGCNGIFLKSAYNLINGLDDYEKMEKVLNLKYVYDDNFLTEKFQLIGGLGFSFKLNVQRRSNDNLSRLLDQAKRFSQIKKYVRSNFNFSKLQNPKQAL